MPSLSEKRLLHYANKFNHHSNNELGDINVNTDELETKLDSVIINTNHNQHSGSSTTVIAGHATETTIGTVGSKFSAMGNICFRYFRMRTTDNTGSPITVVVEYSVKNLN